jgi:hypothetical protein
MKYADHIDYLVALVIYLGSSKFWWARSPEALSQHLGLEERRVLQVLDGFPGLFRRGRYSAKQKQYFYSLQARYAQYDSENGEEPKQVSDIPYLSMDSIKVVLEFVQKMVEHEKNDRRLQITQFCSIAAAGLAAITALMVAAEVFKPKPAGVGLVEAIPPIVQSRGIEPRAPRASRQT